MQREDCLVLKQQKIAPGHYVLTLGAPRISKTAAPGQFVQVLCDTSSDPLLPRPFSFLTAGSGKIEILYQVVGKGTNILSKVEKGERLSVLGPLGRGFTKLEKSQKAIFVGGGVGIPPLHHLAQEWISKKAVKASDITVLLGARSKQYLLCEKDFKRLGVDLKAATVDGSAGRKGFVTALLSEMLMKQPWGQTPGKKSGMGSDPKVKIYACGPNPMLKAVSAMAEEFNVECEVSVEVPMACGFGACLGCAIAVKDGDSHRFAIACCEGPVFNGKNIIWS